MGWGKRGNPESDLWNHRGFSPVRMSKIEKG